MLLYWLLAYLLAALTCAQSYTCSASSPCAEGCCGTGGYCGFGPTFCGSGNCTSSCSAKSPCDPGWGSKWSAAEKCPLNVCCSKYGFCGTTSDFCGSATVKSPSCSGTSATQRVMGYYESWSPSRACDTMYPEDIPLGAFTHLNYAFGFVDPNSYAVAPMSDTDAGLMPRFTALKQSSPGLQTWISIGGWSMNDPSQPTFKTFSNLAASTSAQNSFYKSLLNFMGTYGFDGVDIDWEYPVAPERGGKPADFANYVSFLKNLRNALGSSGHNYGLTITLPSSYWYMQNFDIVNIEPIVDWFNVMTYDLHGVWDSTDPYVGAIVDSHTNLTEIDQTMDLLWRNNISPSKVTMGLAFYGRSFTLSNPSCNAAGCGFSSGGTAGPCTQTSGILSFSEIEQVIAGGAKVTLNTPAAVKEVTWNKNQWVSYDDAQTLGMKVNYANGKCLGGVMVWATSLDDKNGDAAAALSKATNRQSLALSKAALVNDPISSCVWGPCGGGCPAGAGPAQGGGSQAGSGNVGIYLGCSGGKTRDFCCPRNDIPTCIWRGTAPFCGGSCQSGEVEVASDLSAGGWPCLTGHKNLCCQSTVSDESYKDCTWVGSAPICSLNKVGKASCPSGETMLTYDEAGEGGQQPCTSGYKSLCCTQPVPYQNCEWIGKSGVSGFFGLCSPSCPPGQYPIATDPGGCIFGTQQFFCCDVPITTDNPQINSIQTLMQDFAKYNTPGCVSHYLTKRDFAKLANNPYLDLSTKRDLANLRRQVGDPTLGSAQINQLFGSLSSLFLNGAQTSVQEKELQLYNSILEPVLNASASDFATYYNTFPAFDPVELTAQVACDGANAGADIANQQRNQELCILPTKATPAGCTKNNPNGNMKMVKLKRNLTSLTDAVSFNLDKRTLTNSPITAGTSSLNPVPIARLMQAVVTADMTFQYANLVNIRNIMGQDNMNGPLDQQQGILELAWLMAPTNNIHDVQSQYQEFYGTGTTGNPPADLFFVVHFHIDHVLYTPNGNPYLGIYAITGFHGQYVNTQNRVDGNSVGPGTSRRNDRTPVLECEGYGGVLTAEPNEYVYPGFNTGGGETELEDFLQYLYLQGHLTRATVAPIIATNEASDSTTNNCEFFDWTQLPGGSTGSINGAGGHYQPPAGST